MSFTIVSVAAQQLSPAVVAGAGNHYSNQEYHLSWTLGETIITTQSQAGATLLQGFQQPNYLFDVLVEEPNKGYKIKLFPNPTPNWITIEISGPEQAMTAELFDILGHLILRKDIEPPLTNFDLSGLPSATYLLVVLDDKNVRVGAWRIQKLR